MSATRFLPVALILLSIAALATENLVHYPVGIMFMLGVHRIWINPKEALRSSDTRLLVTVFACVWVPMLLALPDAANPVRAFKTTALYLHFLPAGIYIIHMVRDLVVRRIVLAGIAVIVAFWCIDGVIQLVAGRDLFDYPYEGSVLKGIFYPKQRFGLILAVFMPLYVHAVNRAATRSVWAWLLLLPMITAVMFSLKRTAWIMLAVALGAYVSCFFRVTRPKVLSVAVAVGLVVATLAATIAFVPNVNKQMSGSLKMFSTDFATADIATSHRLSLWKTGLAVARAHWLNGVGPRGYRTVYRDFAEADDFWINRGKTGQTHPHLMALEISVETGAVGLIGYGAVLFLLVRNIWRRRTRDPASAVCLMVVLVAWFPLNAHLAFYGSYWSTIVWIMIALGCTAADKEGARSCPTGAAASCAP